MARVLVVDDDRDAARLLTTVLSAAGFAAEAVHDERCATRVLLREDVAVVLSSFSGVGVAATTDLVGAVRRRPETPLTSAAIVALVDDERDAALGLGAAADEVLVRPVGVERLVDAVTDAAATASTVRAARRAGRVPGGQVAQAGSFSE